jgi:hypothetical protein
MHRADGLGLGRLGREEDRRRRREAEQALLQAAAVATAQAAKPLEIRRERIRPPALGKGG